MEIRSFGVNTATCEVMRVSKWLSPEPLKDPLGGVEHEIKATEEKLNESGDITNVRTEVHMSPEEYRYMIKEALLKGQYDAWDLARRVAAFGEDVYDDLELCQAFGACNQTIIFNLPPDEAIEKDKAYQKKKEELHVGDEVKFRDTGMACGYVVETGMSEFATVLSKDRTTHMLRISNLAKTGKFNEDLVKGLAAFDE